MKKKERNYDEWFSVEYKAIDGGDFFKWKSNEKLGNSIKVVLKKHFHSIKEKYDTKENVYYRWFEFLLYNRNKFESMDYSNLNVLIEIGKQFIIDNLTDSLVIKLQWNSQTDKDYINNTFILRKEHDTITVKRQELWTVEIDVNLNEEIKKV